MLVDEDNQYYCAQNDVLFDKAMTKLICYPSAKPDSYYSVPDGVTTIGECAFFASDNLTYVSLPETLRIIESSAFSGGSYASVYLPSK